MLPEAQVLLLTDEAEKRSRWTAMLSSSSVRVVQRPEELTEEDRIDVVIADHDVVGDLLSPRHAGLMRVGPGIISVGASPLADVALPSDFSRRELKLACLLLAEVVQLRRQLRRGQRAQKLLARLADPQNRPPTFEQKRET